MYWACYGNHLSVCKWLVLNGALNDPTTEHIDQAILEDAFTLEDNPGRFARSQLLPWARKIIETHDTFLNVFLRASVIPPASQQHAHPTVRCLLPRLPRAVLERARLFIGVEMGQRVRNVRKFKEALDLIELHEDKHINECSGGQGAS